MTVTAPQPLDLSHHYSYTAKNRIPSSVKSFYKYYSVPGIANLAGGLPNPAYFPYDTLEATVAKPERLKPSTDADSKPDRVNVPKLSQTADIQTRIDLTTALQYGTAEGYPALLAFLRQFVRNHLHPNVPYEGGADIILSCGNTDGFSKALDLFVNPWNPHRDWVHQREGILCEEFTYMNAIQTAQPLGLNIVGVAMDGEGMRASGKGGLADVLENWNFRQGRRPHVMYTVTVGQNPSGAVLPIERKKEIYAICQRYDVVVVEDEPYWNLQFPSAYEMEAHARGLSGTSSRYNKKQGKSSGYSFLDSLVPSYLSIDTDGRVVRLDTFSKTIAPGSRLGWITAQPAIIERLTRITESSTQQPSGFVQSIIAETIMGNQCGDSKSRVSKVREGKGWQMAGWVRWLEGLRAGYEKRMQAMCTILEDNKFFLSEDFESFPSATTNQADGWEIIDRIQMFNFVWPKAGMFAWIEVYFETHPLRSQYSSEKISQALWVHLTRKPTLCLVGPGSMFAPTSKSLERAHRYIRISFAPMDLEEVAPFTSRLVHGFRSFWKRKNLDDLEDDISNLDMLAVRAGSRAHFSATSY
ncbi:hypothetical protein N7478_005726 [Penicillium angulare]|uniref:uncharacterized protein n=1 Tax=Penicillium angulare TaxID=116970 RepID=UPI002541C12F|nr:uncharacterized protein N7478_005726 [Penicillium angulare]KAJ5280354.1 hypothetical protein N7478_005726 [Penicillium angulare]